MSITLGIYDLFSYAIPGIFYLFIFYELLRLFQLPIVDLPLDNDGVHLILLGLLSYLVGHLFDNVSRYLWYRLFYPGNSPERAFSRFSKYSDSKTKIAPHQWPIVLSKIRNANPEVSNSTEKNKATSIMLRNVSFALFLLAIVVAFSAYQAGFSLLYLLGVIFPSVIGFAALCRREVINTIQKNKTTSIRLRNISIAFFFLSTVFTVLAIMSGFSVIYLLGVMLPIMLSFVSMRRGDEFNQWFYMEVFQQSLIYGNSLREILDNKPSQPPLRKTMRKRI